ncbi:unnamed protein product, partial [Choristocarpus tenellus]
MSKYELHDACYAGDLALVKIFLQDSGESVNIPGPKKRTPLHYASKGNHPDIASLLISSGANMEARTAYKMTPLHVAAFYGSAAVVERLITKYEVELNASDFGAWTPLHYSCHYNWPEVSLLLIKHGASLSVKSAELQYVAIHLAARAGDLPTVKALVAKGANVNKRNSLRLTPLHLACQNNNTDVVRYLLEQGASSDIRDEAGITPAQLTRRQEILDLLK